MRFSTAILHALILATGTSVQASDRCNYVDTPVDSETIWRYKGENVTLSCPGYQVDSSLSYSVKFTWYEEEYNCKSMTRTYASYINHIAGSSRVIMKYPERMTIDKTSGELTITNLTSADEKTLTCIFMQLEEHIASVHLRIKVFQRPVLNGLSTSLVEDEVRIAECVVPKMLPTQGFIQVTYQGKLMKSINLVEGSVLSPVMIPITGEAKAESDTVTCLAVQNIFGSVRQLSTSAVVTVHYPYHTKVISSSGGQPIEFSNVTLSCEVTRQGNPAEIIEYTWMRNGNEITVPANQNIPISDIRQEDEGSYQCLIVNKPEVSTPLKNAQELRLDIVRISCLPQLKFDADNVMVEENALMATWTAVYPVDCIYNNPIELVIEVQEKGEILKQSTAMLSEKHITFIGNYDIKNNYTTCLIIKKYPKKTYCASAMKGSEQVGSLENSMERTGLIVGCTILACVALAVIIGIVIAMMPKSKTSKYQVNQLHEDQYEDLDPSELKDGGDPTESAKNYETDDPQSGKAQSCIQLDSIYGLMQGNSSLPNLPSLPDVKDLNGSRPLELCPEEEQHYKNRTMIMAATMPTRRNRISVPKTQSLEDIIEYCKENYIDKKEISQMEGEPGTPGDYMDMGGVAKVMDDESAEN